MGHKENVEEQLPDLLGDGWGLPEILCLKGNKFGVEHIKHFYASIRLHYLDIKYLPQFTQSAGLHTTKPYIHAFVFRWRVIQVKMRQNKFLSFKLYTFD
jgi:hypothetical protein